MSEEDLCNQLADYLRLKHPTVLFHFDFGSGTKLGYRQAAKQKRLNQRAWPDLFIATAPPQALLPFFGLFIELKRDGTKLKKKNGEWATEHIGEQATVLEALASEGYIAQFACGFDQAMEVIESYLEVAA